MSQSLARALSILVSLGEQPHSLDELAEQLGVHKTTVLRLLRTLQDEHFVHRDGGHRFHLGSRLFALAGAALEEREVRAVAAPHLARLNQTTGQTVHLGVHEDGIVVYLDKHESRQPIRMYSRVGLPMPLHCTAIAKVLLADLPQAERRRTAEAIEYTRFTDRTITDSGAFLAELATVAEQGWAMDDAEHEDFITCIAAPVRDATGRVIAAASVSVPHVLLSREQVLALLPDLREAARRISADCGHQA
ncbi:MAG TPA: IclR family transcriptional regulator [Streptomyces sp.]|jgi:DNA-binding IclR family transcriptional regulator|nr:IclR family transcriptional regulator [Streptomyces sp.]